MVNIRDIAKKANVSITTVSRVINGHPYVKEDKRERVLAIMEEIGYQINMNAVHLSKGITKRIGVIIPFVSHPYFSLLSGIYKGAFINKHHLLVMQTNYDNCVEVECLNMLKNREVDGIIIVSCELDQEIIADYKPFGPIVFCGEFVENFRCITIDHAAAFQLGLEELFHNGHTKIGYTLGRKNSHNSHVRALTYKNFMEIRTLPYDSKWIFDGAYTMEDGERIYHMWNKLRDKPTGLLVTNDQVAAGFLLAANKERNNLKSFVQIIGFDNQYISQLLSFSTIELPLIQMGETSFHLLFQEIKHVKLGHLLIKR
ncbi:hypothetical protein Q73_06650 [Bacillus coahuilensis m2-6]|uniref:LacI family DNA-binding transcriptional regulator n=1 Tax=Bacillus coahuilensis TaxID=408580 RepID=UPI000750071E|nr:LacI family DNA-binding transcriptional regulator [Bacillus coahuilensis]KUP08406.1 hypothetical protein Q73_06650 [Bacillus coahuilensis m2-6]